MPPKTRRTYRHLRLPKGNAAGKGAPLKEPGTPPSFRAHEVEAISRLRVDQAPPAAAVERSAMDGSPPPTDRSNTSEDSIATTLFDEDDDDILSEAGDYHNRAIWNQSRRTRKRRSVPAVAPAAADEPREADETPRQRRRVVDDDDKKEQEVDDEYDETWQEMIEALRGPPVVTNASIELSMDSLHSLPRPTGIIRKNRASDSHISTTKLTMPQQHIFDICATVEGMIGETNGAYWVDPSASIIHDGAPVLPSVYTKRPVTFAELATDHAIALQHARRCLKPQMFAAFSAALYHVRQVANRTKSVLTFEGLVHHPDRVFFVCRIMFICWVLNKLDRGVVWLRKYTREALINELYAIRNRADLFLNF